jgi:hypothetical protein
MLLHRLTRKMRKLSSEIGIFGWLIERNRVQDGHYGTKVELIPLPENKREERGGELRREWEERIEGQRLRLAREQEERVKRREAE